MKREEKKIYNLLSLWLQEKKSLIPSLAQQTTKLCVEDFWWRLKRKPLFINYIPGKPKEKLPWSTNLEELFIVA